MNNLIIITNIITIKFYRQSRIKASKIIFYYIYTMKLDKLQFVSAFVLKVSCSYAVRGSRGSTFSVSAKTTLSAILELFSQMAPGKTGAGYWKMRTSAGGTFSEAAEKYSHRRLTELYQMCSGSHLQTAIVKRGCCMSEKSLMHNPFVYKSFE